MKISEAMVVVMLEVTTELFHHERKSLGDRITSSSKSILSVI